MSKPRLAAVMLACLAAGTASGQPVRVASWNLGWHVSQAEVPNWVPKGAGWYCSLASPAGVDALCHASKTRKLSQDEGRIVASDTGLGCRNGVGLDHVLVSEGLESRVRAVLKLSLGRLGRTMAPRPDKTEPLLSISDHCPIVATNDFQ